MANLSERTYHDTSSVYSLPNDAPEHERLDMQTRAINSMMGDKPVRAPVSEPKRILEVGCGTGIMTRYLADKFATATDVIGIDLSPVPEQQVDTKAAFIQGDFFKVAEHTSNPRLAAGSIDYIFSRMLVYGMHDWPDYIARAKNMLAPGGWLELQEIDMSGLFDRNQSLLSTSWSWLREQQTAWAQRSLDMSCAPKLERYLRDAGFEDVHAKEFRWMYGPWEGHPETLPIATYSTAHLASANFGAFKKVCGAGKTDVELENIWQEMRESYSWSEDGKHNRLFVVYGKKA